MGRIVFIDESNLENYVKTIYGKKVLAEVGLLIGKCSVLSKDYIFSLIRTPLKEEINGAYSNACIIPAINETNPSQSKSKKGSKARIQDDSINNSPLIFDQDWIIEHARQVSRMLPGGLQVLGMYVFSPEPNFKTSTSSIHQILKGINKDIYCENKNEKIILHVCSSPKKFSCKSCNFDSSFSFQPCDLKYENVLSNFYSLSSLYPINLKFPLKNNVKFEDFNFIKKNFEMFLSMESNNLKDFLFLVQDDYLDSEKPLPVKYEKKENLSVDFLVSPSWESQSQGQSHESSECIGFMNMEGCIHGVSFAHTKQSIKDAVQDLKSDILKSLKVRFDLILEDFENEDAVREESQIESKSKSNSESNPNSNSLVNNDEPPNLDKRFGKTFPALVLPKRVCTNWLSKFYLCDYVSHDESLQDARERLQAMFHLNLNDINLIELEECSNLFTLNSKFEEESVSEESNSKTSGTLGQSQSQSQQNFNSSLSSYGFSFSVVLGSSGFLLLSIVIMMWMHNSN